MDYGNPRFGSWCQPGQTQTAGTAIVVPIDPYRPGDGSPLIYENKGSLTNPIPNWYDLPLTKVTSLAFTSGATAHTWYVLRPKNWTTIAATVTANDTTIVMADNPGLYATTYKYRLPPGVSRVPGLVADNTPASGDYCAFQLDNGAWHFSLISSLSSLTLTIATGTPNVTGATAAVGRVLFFFAAGGDNDPATNRDDPLFLPPASATTTLRDNDGLVTSLHPGDPLLIVNANASNASTLVHAAGVFAKF